MWSAECGVKNCASIPKSAIRIPQSEGDSPMNSGHWKKMKFFDGNPSSFSISFEGLAVINREGEFEVGEGLSESSDKLLDFDIQSQVFSDIIS